MKKLILIPILLCAAAASGVAQSVIIPQTMSFQGYVEVDSNGTPAAYTDTSGNTIVTLVLYDDSALSGNTHVVWSDPNQSVKVFHGYYSATLDLSSGWSAGVVRWSKQYWLDATVLSHELTPRVRLTASAYSFVAQVADSARASHIADTALNVVSGSPIGTIEAYGGDITQLLGPATGWMVCNGDSILISDYPNYNIYCGAIYGHSADQKWVYLPDLRGMFLRGVNDTRDDTLQDTTGRIPPRHGGLAGNQVGSIQQDAFQGHMHDFWAGAYPQGTNGTDPTQATLLYGAMDNYDDIHRVVTNPQTGRPQGMLNGGVNGWEHWTIASDTVDGNPRYSSETRPKNAYVYWIIKVK